MRENNGGFGLACSNPKVETPSRLSRVQLHDSELDCLSWCAHSAWFLVSAFDYHLHKGHSLHKLCTNHEQSDSVGVIQPDPTFPEAYRHPTLVRTQRPSSKRPPNLVKAALPLGLVANPNQALGVWVSGVGICAYFVPPCA